MTDMRQYALIGALVNRETGARDLPRELQALALTPGSKCFAIGEQGDLFTGEHVVMVAVVNGKQRVECTAELAASYGFRASQ